MVINEISKQEFEDQLFQMALHGVPKEKIDKLRRQFCKEEKVKDVKIPLTDFQNLGLKLGKPNTTKVIRDKK